MPERPDWCEKINCGCYHSSGRCVLEEWVEDSTSLHGARRTKYSDFRRMTPVDLKGLCGSVISGTTMSFKKGRV